MHINQDECIKLMYSRDVAKFDRSRSRDRCRRNRKGLSFFYIMTSVHSELSQYIENIEKYRKRFDRRSIEFRKVPNFSFPYLIE